MKKATIYTRKGDSGETSLIGGTRVPKDHARVEAYGTIDELNACIGVLAAACSEAHTPMLERIENNLLTIGCSLADESNSREALAQGETDALEHAIDTLESGLPPMHSFILPCKGEAAARANMCRTICRRAERRMTTLQRECPVAPCAMQYLNRLSDYFFLLQRTLCEGEEKKWQNPCM